MEEAGEKKKFEMHTSGDKSQEELPRWMEEEVEVDASLESMVDLAASQLRNKREKPGSGQVDVTWVGGKLYGRDLTHERPHTAQTFRGRWHMPRRGTSRSSPSG
jgi:hypothetical protein